MIIVILAPPATGKTQLAKALERAAWPQVAHVINDIPTRHPGWLASLTIYTTNREHEDLPGWLVKRKDFTVINITAFQRNEEV